MSKSEGYYIYGIIGTSQGQEFGPIGIGERGNVVYTLPYQKLAAIVSKSPLVKYAVTRDNSMAHIKVLIFCNRVRIWRMKRQKKYFIWTFRAWTKL
jgi:Gas vesicle synthesis protein GvpL/GvpF